MRRRFRAIRIALVENQWSLPLLGALAGAVLAFVLSDFDRKPDPDEWGTKVDRVVRNVARFTRRASASAERTQRRYDPLTSAELVPPPSSEPVLGGALDKASTARTLGLRRRTPARRCPPRISRTDRLSCWSVRAECP